MEVVENKREYLGDFIRLNEHWISTYFKVEDVDRALAANPYQVVENGGYIFTLVTDVAVLGVCALFHEGEGVFELARMAVSPEHQGKGYSHLLMKACLAKLSEIDAKKVFLVSNTKLDTAISLYEKYDFKAVFEGKHPIYSRANMVMERHVS